MDAPPIHKRDIKRVPLPKAQNKAVPMDPSSRYRDLKTLNLMDNRVEKKILDELRTPESQISEAGLISALALRLTKVEQQLKQAYKGLQQKEKEMEELLNELNLVSRNRVASAEIKELKRENLILRKQIEDMEKFLNDYGLVWVGNTEEPNDTDDEIPPETNIDYTTRLSLESPPPGLHSKSPENSRPSKLNEFSLDLPELKKRIAELNVIAGDGVAKVVAGDGGCRLKNPEPIPITIWKDGFVLSTQPFRLRRFNETDAQAFLRDILDGYFPLELKEKFPDGVPFVLVDKHDEFYDQSSPKTNIATLSTMHNISNRKSGTEHFLNRLPKSVISNGRVVDVRHSITSMVKDNPKEDVEIPTYVQKGAIDVTSLKIQTEEGVFKMSLKCDDTIKTVREYLDPIMKAAGILEYEIRTAFPPKIYSYLNQTLRAAGLVPNATIFVRKTRK